MKKRFNTTGTCIENKHYMVNIENKLDKIESMVSFGDYFIINRPRQYGKTTTLYKIYNRLSNNYIIIKISFEGIGDLIFESEEYFSKEILNIFVDSLEFENEEYSNILRQYSTEVKNLKDVSKILTRFLKTIDKEVILIIDEVDKSSNNQLFLSFLGMLRNKYLLANENRDITFKSVILAGVYDIKNLKLKISDNKEKKLNSPWNIAVNFNVDMSFDAYEIKTMLDEYNLLNNLTMDTQILSQKLYYYTSGYPFLVSRLCQIIDEDILIEKRNWTIKDLEVALKYLLKEKNTLFDDLIKNLKNNNELYNYIFDIVVNGVEHLFNIDNTIIDLGCTYGILKESNGIVKIHNRTFEQRIYNYMISTLDSQSLSISNYNFRDNFINKDGSLDFEKILLKFQQFMKEQHSNNNDKFIEHHARLLFLSFIKPIINGVGFDFKEVQISEEKRLDVVITYNKFKYIVELKIWKGAEYHKKGLSQLSDYLDIHSINEGYMVIFNFNKGKEYKQEQISIEGKDIFAVYV